MMFLNGFCSFSKLVIGLVLIIVSSAVVGWEDNDDVHYTNSWAVHLENGNTEVANRIAKRHGFVNLGQVGSLPGYYHFVHKPSRNRRKRREVDKTELLLTEKEVKWVEQQHVLERDKRSTVIPDFVGISHPDAVTIQDPLFKDQWYLSNIGQSSGPPNLDINVLPVWAKGITGRGVVVAVLDDGLDHTHPDLVRNFDSKASYDFNDYDNDPMPRVSDPNNCHGTKCAGQVAAESGNGICGVGVAFNSSIGGIRMLDGNTTDTIEGSSLSFRNNYIHIYSCAWGPKDDGKRFGRPGTLASKALELGTKEGRGGLGSIFVWATGNGGLTDDDCNCDGYTTSIHTISIGAISDHGLSTYYTESCASTLAVTYSGGSHREKRENKIITTTLNHKCTDKFKGTSSAAPLAAGMIALMLEANPKLTWRDVQAVIVETALMTSPLDEGWRRNGAGKWFNQKFGFGRIDASQLVEKAKNWDNIAEQKKCWANKNVGPWKIPESGTVLVSSNTSACSGSDMEVRSLEHVQLVISLKHRHRGHLSIELISPSGTRSQILKTRRNDHSNKGLKDWIFMSVHFWGEDPRGTWTLAVTDNNNNNRKHYRAKMKHGDLEDATEALQDELLGKPHPVDEDTEASSQEHEGVLDKNKEKLDSKLSEDFEGGIFEDGTYRNTRKEREKEEAERRKNRHIKAKKSHSKNQHKKKVKHHHHHHRHHHHKHRYHKKDKPTAAVKQFTFIPTLFGKTFEDLAKQKQATGTRHPQTQQSTIPGQNQRAGSQNWNQSQIQNNLSKTYGPASGSVNNGPVSSQTLPGTTGISPDQTLKPTTRQSFGHQELTTPASSQHDLIQSLVKSVLSEMFTALRSQRNDSRNLEGIGQTISSVEGSLSVKNASKEPVENVSSSLSKAWRKEKGVQKINTLLGILDKVRNVSRKLNNSEGENNTRGDEMVSDVLKVLRDILSAGKVDDKVKDFKTRVSKLVEDSSTETRNLTQRLFDDLEPGADTNRTGIVINDALSLISAIFEGDSQKKKNINPSDLKSQSAGQTQEVGIVLRGPDGSFIIPNRISTDLQMQTGPANIVKTWGNASQIETVRIEHTKVSPVNVANLGVTESGNGTEEFNRVDVGKVGKEEKKKMEDSEDENDIDFEVERSGDGREMNFHPNVEKNNMKQSGGKVGERNEPTKGNLLNMRELKKGKEGLKNGFASDRNYHKFGLFSHNFIGSNLDELEINPVHGKTSTDKDELKENVGIHDRKIDSSNTHLDFSEHNPDFSERNLDSSERNQDSVEQNPDSRSGDDKIDVTVVFDDDNKSIDFMKEVNKDESDIKKDKASSSGLKDVEEFTVKKPKKIGSSSKKKHKGRHHVNIPQGFFQPSNYDGYREQNDDYDDDDDKSRSKGEIPESEVDDDGENEESSTNVYDARAMQNSLPFYPMPVPDQRGYGLLTQFMEPFQDAAYSQGIDVLNAIEQEPLIEDSRDYYEPNYRREWKRSLSETYQPTTKTLKSNQQQMAKSRNRRSSQDAKLPIPNIPKSISQLRGKHTTLPVSKRASDITTARQRFEDLVEIVHRNPPAKLNTFNFDHSRFTRSYLSDQPISDTDAVKHRRRRSVEEPVNKRSTKSKTNHVSTAKSRKRRSVDKISSAIDPVASVSGSNKTVYREKRDKIIDDYDDGDYDEDNENEPHVVKRSAIFSELRPSEHSKRFASDDSDDVEDSDFDSRQFRSKRDSEDDMADDNDDQNSDTRSSVGKRKISSLEGALRKKVLSMRSQSKSVMKLLQRVHDDISFGDINDLRELETKISGMEKQQSEKKARKYNGKRKEQRERAKSKVKTKSITPKTNSGENNDDNDVEKQEKLDYKQDPDEYLKYGAGNTGGLDSWTLVFYGT